MKRLLWKFLCFINKRLRLIVKHVYHLENLDKLKSESDMKNQDSEKCSSEVIKKEPKKRTVKSPAKKKSNKKNKSQKNVKS